MVFYYWSKPFSHATIFLDLRYRLFFTTYVRKRNERYNGTVDGTIRYINAFRLYTNIKELEEKTYLVNVAFFYCYSILLISFDFEVDGLLDVFGYVFLDDVSDSLLHLWGRAEEASARYTDG